MKFLHLSDLHLGKQLKGFALLDDQEYILNQIAGIVGEEKPDAVVIAGDIYDSSTPPADAVTLFDYFITKLHKLNTQVIAISGNHDNAKRVAFGSKIMSLNGIHISPAFNGALNKVTIADEFGPVNFYMMPFLRLSEVKQRFPDAGINNYTDAIRTVVNALGVNSEERNVVVSHQFVTGAEVSEEEHVGGLENVDRQAYDVFEYVALGHLHLPQHVGIPTVRYSGSPLKYSISEIRRPKTVTVVEMGAKGSGVQLRYAPLVPIRDMRELRGSLQELLSPEFDSLSKNDYLNIVLTDPEMHINAIGRLRSVYPNVMSVKYEKLEQRMVRVAPVGKIDDLTPAKLFAKFFQERTEQQLSAQQEALLNDLLASLDLEDINKASTAK